MLGNAGAFDRLVAAPPTHPHHRYQFSVGQKAKQIDSLL